MITTDIFYKATDTHNYLNFYSCHPSHTKRNIPYTLARKVCTVVDTLDERNQRLQELEYFLKLQKYPEGVINAGIEKARDKSIEELRQVSQRQESDQQIIPFVVTHNPHHLNIVSIAKMNFPILQQSARLQQLISHENIIGSRRQPKNLKRILTRARFVENPTIHRFLVSKCNDRRCGTCAFMSAGSIFPTKSGRVIRPNTDLNCKSSNLIYCIKCCGCDEIYIGQTGNTICERVRIHKQQIRSPYTRKIPLSQHIDVCGKGLFNVFPFYKMKDTSSTKRLLKEEYFTKLFQPKLNGR